MGFREEMFAELQDQITYIVAQCKGQQISIVVCAHIRLGTENKLVIGANIDEYSPDEFRDAMDALDIDWGGKYG